jgi:hypothetical protein
MYPLLVHVMGMTAMSNETDGRPFRWDPWNVRTYTRVTHEENLRTILQLRYIKLLHSYTGKTVITLKLIALQLFLKIHLTWSTWRLIVNSCANKGTHLEYSMTFKTVYGVSWTNLINGLVIGLFPFLERTKNFCEVIVLSVCVRPRPNFSSWTDRFSRNLGEGVIFI